jgi:CBS domain containing-hemolysin-like protein
VTDQHLLLTIGLVSLLVLDLLASTARAALFNTSPVRILGQQPPTLPQVKRTLALLASLPRLQASLNLSRAVFRFFLAGLVLSLFLPWEEAPYPFFPALGILLLAALVVFLLEWTTEKLVASDPETWALRLTLFARILTILTYPLVSLSLILTRALDIEQENMTENELMSLVEAGQQEGAIEQGEHKMIVSIVRLGDTLAREIMVPRIDILALDVNTPLQQAVEVLISSGHSRVPVYMEGVDNILGLLYSKDLLRVWQEGRQIDSLADLQLRTAYFVPEAKKADELLAELLAQRIHMAIVVDEYGGVAGLVTLEDIVEEIVGEIRDEYDQAEELLFQVLNAGEYVFQGRVDLDDFNEIMGSDLPKSEADTLGGFIYSRIGRVPTAGDKIQVDNLQLTVEQVSGQRIRKVHARRLPPASKNGEDETDVDQ